MVARRACGRRARAHANTHTHTYIYHNGTMHIDTQFDNKHSMSIMEYIYKQYIIIYKCHALYVIYVLTLNTINGGLQIYTYTDILTKSYSESRLICGLQVLSMFTINE